LSLRDLAPQILLASTNFVDDVEHCLKANTSPHLVEQLTGNRDFLQGTLGDLMSGRAPAPPADRPLIFSPFGLGVLDLAVGYAATCRSSGMALSTASAASWAVAEDSVQPRWPCPVL
jgi:ornithine cyclodeaminase/alanine dehydrogenase-like protein (mu-crystallin family)